jgi:hypothetical protein
MHPDRQTESLRDDLGLELERLVAIEPAPELRARVRERVAATRIATPWQLRWQFAAVAAIVTLLAAVPLVPLGERVSPPLPVIPPSNAPAISMPVLPLDVALSVVLRPPSQRAVRSERTPPNFPSLVMPPLEPLTQISIESVAIEPLGVIPPLAGEHQ